MALSSWWPEIVSAPQQQNSEPHPHSSPHHSTRPKCHPSTKGLYEDFSPPPPPPLLIIPPSSSRSSNRCQTLVIKSCANPGIRTQDLAPPCGNRNTTEDGDDIGWWLPGASKAKGKGAGKRVSQRGKWRREGAGEGEGSSEVECWHGFAFNGGVLPF